MKDECLGKQRDMAAEPSLLALQQALRKNFQCLESNRRLWGSVLAECVPLTASLGNLAEQLRALAAVDLSDTPLADFPDLEDLLRLKLLQAADTVMEKLHGKLSSLQSVRDSVGSQVAGVVQLYERSAGSLGLAACARRSAAAPSVADMLEWLQDAERYYRRQFLRRKTLLLTLRPGDLSLLESAPKRWESLDSPGGEQRIADTLFKVSLFLETQ